MSDNNVNVVDQEQATPDTQPETDKKSGSNNKKKSGAKKEERVTVFIDRASGKDDPNLFVCVNGVNYILPRGKESSVPAHVAKEIERAKRAAAKRDDHIDEMVSAGK